MEDDDSRSSLPQPRSSPTFGKDGSFQVSQAVGSASISPSGRDIVLGSSDGLHIIDLDKPYSPPRTLSHQQPWEVADVQWSPFAVRDYWVVSTSNQKALVWNLNLPTSQAPIEHVLHGHSRAITDINFSAHDPDMLATCSVDSLVQCWDLRTPRRPAMTFADWYAGASQVKWNRQDRHILASSHDRFLHIWDDRKGVEPLRTIPAHSTKIYGIDWNRTERNHILTCSLDMSMKFWNYEDHEDEPKRVIRTDYPIWRARHTPFGRGVLAMPQRGGDDAIHLYDARLDEGQAKDVATKPLHIFDGHMDKAKEFLWRSQGTVNESIDDREFQLVSWGTDNSLLLHRLDVELTGKVGYRKGQPGDGRIRFTRQGADYRTFHEIPSFKITESHGLSSLFKSPARQGIRPPTMSLRGRNSSSKSGNKQNHPKKDMDPISWMKGVRIQSDLSDEAQQEDVTSTNAPPWATRESLGEEIIHVGDKYKKVSFDEVNIPDRQATFSLTGPWGPDGELSHLRVQISFPDEYPGLATPQLTIEKTPSMSDAALTRLRLEVRTICDAYSDLGRGSLEALICYLLGEWDINEAMAWVDTLQNAMKLSLASLDPLNDGDSSSDDEIGPAPIAADPGYPMPTGDVGQTAMGITNANANVPLPKACGALWAEDGRLVCFFPQKDEASLLFSTSNLGSNASRPQSRQQFESFGTLGGAGPRAFGSLDDDDSSAGSEDSSSTSSSHSTDTSDPSMTEEPLGPIWQGIKSGLNGSRSLDQSSVRNVAIRRPPRPQQVITLQDHDDLLPVKKCLAEDYIVFGSSEQVCSHNSEVALRHGFRFLADVWQLLMLLLDKSVPLKVELYPGREDTGELMQIAARRALDEIERHIGHVTLPFDDPPLIDCSQHTSGVDWPCHGLGPTKIQTVLDYFEAVGDIQMLAMISCVLAERSLNEVVFPRLREWHVATRLNVGLDDIPGITMEYFENDEAMLSLLMPTEAETKSPLGPPIKLVQEPSYSSSTVVWSSDGTETGQRASYQRDLSPVELTRQNSHSSTLGHSYSSSPGETYIKRSHSMLSSKFAASLSRPFSFMTSTSASPPSHPRTPELSTSAPSSGIDVPNFISKRKAADDSSTLPRIESRSSLSHELDVGSISDADSDADSDVDWEAVIHMNARAESDMHDAEGFLPDAYEGRYVAWREAYAHLLFVWQLPFKRAEVLSFNRPVSGLAMQSEATQFVNARVYCALCYDPALDIVPTCARCGQTYHETCLETLGGYCPCAEMDDDDDDNVEV